MMRRAALTALIACSATFLSLDSLACGESLFRVGKGLTYRDYTAPFPGNILIVANTEGEVALVERLAAAGHHVHVVSDPAEIGDQLQDEQFEIVMAYYTQREIVETQLRDSSITYLPVAHAGTPEEELAESEYRRSLSSDDSVKTFLKTIHRTLKDQQSS
jgi:hypothetical protein